MPKNRYMVVDHHCDTKLSLTPEGKVDGKLCIHHLLGTYHWSRLDDHTVIVVGDYGITRHNDLLAHPHVSMMPHTSSQRTVKNHIRKTAHENCKERHIKSLETHCGLTDNCHLEDVIERVAAKHGPMFHLR